MAGMFSNNNDFSWNSDTIFDKIGNQEKREEYLTELSGTGNNEREMIMQLRSLDMNEMKLSAIFENTIFASIFESLII